MKIRVIWTYQVLHALQDFPAAQRFLDAIRSRKSIINLKRFELILHEHITGGWRELDNLTPHETHHSSRIMKPYHTHFGVPLRIVPSWWDDKNITSLCCLFTCAWIFPTSAVHFLAFASLAITLWFKEGVITGGIEGLMSSGAVTIVTGTLSRMRNTFCWSPHEHLVSLRTPHH